MGLDNNYLERIHSEILTVMDEVVRVCNENNLRYYMIGGTLLGAVRHKGYIPWDDDIDIVMPREDFNKFIILCSKALQSPFKLQWITTNEKYRFLFAKVENVNTVFYAGLKYKEDVYPGIYVDIFPIDETNGYSRGIVIRKAIIRKLSTMMGMKLNIEKVRGIRKIILRCLSTKTISKIACFLMTRNNGKSTDYYTNFGSQYNAKRQTIKKSCYGEGILLPFEDRMYNAPVDYQTVLTSIFGPDYMQIPPEDKRRSHYPTYVKFSDGSEMHFDEPEHKVKAEFDL